MKKVKRLILNEDFQCWKKGTVFVEYIFEKNSLIQENTSSIFHSLDAFTDKELKPSQIEAIQNDPNMSLKQKKDKMVRKDFKERFDKSTPKNLDECSYYTSQIVPLKQKISALETELERLNKRLKDIESFN